jgi:hypothetical protein
MRLTPGDKGFVLESKAFDRIGEQLGRVEWGAIALSRQALSNRLVIKPLVVEVQDVLLKLGPIAQLVPRAHMDRQLLAPVRKQAKITGFKFCQVVLRAQWCINALSLQKGARQL